MEPFMICCPGCGTRFSVRTANALGQTRPCPKCAAPIEIVDPNAPLEPPRQSLPWNRWALAGGTAAAILVVVAVLVISRGGAAGSSPEPAEAVADAADVVPSEPDAAPASAPETGESQTEPAPEQPAQGQVTEPPIVDALAAEVQKLLAVEPGEPAEPKASEPKPADLQPTQPAAADTSRTSVPRRPPAAPSAAQRAKSALGSPQSPPEPAHDALLGPARKRAAGQSAAGGPHPPQPSTAGPP
jgi:hypothetical protein